MSDEPSSARSDSVDPKKKARARELWERLANSRPGPANQDLIYLARFVPLLSKAAVKSLVSRKLSVSELKELVQHVPRAQDAAVKAAMKKVDSPSEDDLKFLVTHARSKEAALALLERNPGDGVIGFIERNLPDLSGELDAIREKEQTSVVLREIDRLL